MELKLSINQLHGLQATNEVSNQTNLNFLGQTWQTWVLWSLQKNWVWGVILGRTP